MPWLNIVDAQMVGALGGVAANNRKIVKADGEYEIPNESGIRYIIADAADKTIYIKLPAPASAIGYDLLIKVTNATNKVGIYPHGAECIDGTQQTIKLEVDYSYVRLLSDGTDWHIIG